MSEARVILLTGEPGSGKSTLGRVLAAELRLPFVARDDIRGGLAFTAGVWGDADGFAGMPPGEEAVEAFLSSVEHLLAAGVSCIVEYVVRAHRPDVLPRLRAAGEVIVVRTSCPNATDRMAGRHAAERLIGLPNTLAAAGAASTHEHAALAVERMRHVVAEMLIDFPVPLLDVDTSDGYSPDVESIVAFATADHRDER